MDALQQLQKWYQAQCNGDWEHSYGVSIGTLDNPGWSVVIDLTDTSLYEKKFIEICRIEHETEWIRCQVKDGKFEGHGGPLMLEETIKIFLAWAEEPQAA